MIHIFVGTKAQFIKMMPIMHGLHKRGIDYNFIDAGQHAGITTELIKQFGLTHPDIFLRQSNTNINTINQAIRWIILNFSRSIFLKNRIYNTVFGGKKGICLIHGDTLTTLLSLLFAKRCNIRVAHVEAGLRSYRLFNPFPEEIIRLIVMHFSDMLFAPSDWAYHNLCQMGYQNKAINIGANTGQDALYFAINRMSGKNRPKDPYALITFHRTETIYSLPRLRTILGIIERITQDRTLLVVLHEPTRLQLQKYGLLEKINMFEKAKTLPLLPYLEFIDLAAGADFIITDGGSIQEECYYLNKPCMILRTITERLEGLGENAFLTHFDPEQINRFFRIWPGLKRTNMNKNLKPSEVIIDHLLQCC